MKKFIVVCCLLFAIPSFGSFGYRSDWKVHKLCGESSRHGSEYCLEMIELENDDPQAQAALLIPGFFQNAYIFDLLPGKNISLARYLRKKFNLRPFVLHVRGIGNSDYVKATTLDDMAMDDLPMAVDYLNKATGKNPLIIAHSQGAIVAQAYLAGLSNCLIAPCFNPLTAFGRNRKVLGLAALAGNSAMTVDQERSCLKDWAQAGVKLAPALKFLDEIDVKLAARLTGPLGALGLWKFLYNEENVSYEARAALHSKSLDSSSSGIILQFARGVLDEELKTRSGFSYVKALSSITTPVYQQTYANDPMATPSAVRLDNFEKIGSRRKMFEEIPNRGHEDVFMNRDLHSDLDAAMEFLLR